MTESASGSSRSTHASTPGLVPEHAAMLRREDSRLGSETPVNGASRANPGFRHGTVTRRWLGNLRGRVQARPSAFSLRAARRRLSPAGRTGLLAASRDRGEFPPAAPAPPFPNPSFQRVEEPSALGPRHQSAARAQLSRQGKAGPRSPTADRDCCPPPQLGHRNRVPCVLRRSPRPRHVPHVTPRTPAPAPEAHSPQRRHRHGRCRPDSPCRGHRERRRGRHPQHSASTTRLAPRRDRLHSGSWGHRTLIWHVRAQRELPWRARAGYGESWHHYSSRRWLSKAMEWTPPRPTASQCTKEKAHAGCVQRSREASMDNVSIIGIDISKR